MTEQDCIDYLFQLVIDRTFDGYMTEIKTIYGQLEKELGVKIEPAPDKWDRLYNVDFFIKIENRYIGIQIKPVNQGIQLPQIFKEKRLQQETHEKFMKEYGGKVFYVFSSKAGDKKVIVNKEVIDEIRQEIDRLKN
ncbi:MAG: MjaI family restriction endonuclease [Dehalococcoidia bacterium]|nr:MjaI family restriction endonuclease [Dehalococcoidia bacterium]